MPNRLQICARLKRPSRDTDSIWEAESPCVLLNRSEQKHYIFDKVFGINSSSYKIFQEIVSPVLTKSVHNDLTVLAYGAKGSGKTFTIEGTKLYPGLIPLILDFLFNYVSNNTGEYLIKCSYIELYKDLVYNLITGTISEVQVN